MWSTPLREVREEWTLQEVEAACDWIDERNKQRAEQNAKLKGR